MAFLFAAEALEALAETASAIEGWAALVEETSPLLLSGGAEMTEYGAAAGELADTANAVATTASTAASGARDISTFATAAGAAVGTAELTAKMIHDSARSIAKKRKSPDDPRPKPTAARQLFKDHSRNRGHQLNPAIAHCQKGYPNLYTRQYFSPLLII